MTVLSFPFKKRKINDSWCKALMVKINATVFIK